MIKITFAGVGLHITDSGLLGIKMDEKGQRSLGGKLALWAFYAFCFYFIWMMVRFFLGSKRYPGSAGRGR